MTHRINLLVLVTILMSGCGNGVNQSEYDKLQADYNKLKIELAEYKQTIEELQNTPQVRLAKGQQYLANNDFADAKRELNLLIEKHKNTEEASKALLLVEEIKKMEQAKQEAEERKKALGFKVLKETSSVTVDDVAAKFNSVSTGGNFIFDRYDDSWRYIDAERGEIYILANVLVSSKIKDPKLPPILVYQIENGALNLVGTLEYRFYRWEDYGSYLGNDADYGNDFAHTSTIRFSCGLSISKENIDNKAIFVVVKKENCFYRTSDRFNNPPVSYMSNNCKSKATLTVDDFDNDYILVKIFNKTKL